MPARVGLLALVLVIAVQGANSIRGQERTPEQPQPQTATTSAPKAQHTIGEEVRDIEGRVERYLASSSGGGLSLLTIILLAIYFFPSIIAAMRHHHNILAIFLLNLLLGWTLLGWVAALVWAATEPRSIDQLMRR